MTNDFIVGVPFIGFENHIVDVNKTIIATREDEALGIAVGAYLAGKNPLVFMQNSGMGNCFDILTSLLVPYGIKIDILVDNRESPEHHITMFNFINPAMGMLGYEKVSYR